MPYSSVSEVPVHVPKAKRRQWLEVWNSVYASTHDESRAFAEANSVTSKVAKDYNPDEERDESGKWTSGGSGGSASTKEEHEQAAHEHREAGIHEDVNGNREAAHAHNAAAAKHELAAKDPKRIANGKTDVANAASREAYEVSRRSSSDTSSDKGGAGKTGNTSKKNADELKRHGWQNTSTRTSGKDNEKKDVWTHDDHPGHSIETTGNNHFYQSPHGWDVGYNHADLKERLGNLHTKVVAGGIVKEKAMNRAGSAMIPQEFHFDAEAGTYRTFMRLAKVDESKRQVWGVVTAEVPDKEDEVCDYSSSVPYYKSVISEMDKATSIPGVEKNYFPLRIMHSLREGGKCVGFEFRDADKEIFMGFEVVDDDAWMKVRKGIFTGFSQGGRVMKAWDDPVYRGCTRYTANPAEISLVDNPCLGVAHYSYVKSDGSSEMRKLRSIGDDGVIIPRDKFNDLVASHSEMRKAMEQSGIIRKAKTKHVAGKDLTSDDFAYVGDPDKTDTWKLPIHDAAHVRNALARFDQTQGIPADKRDSVYARITAAAKKFDIEVSGEKALMAAIRNVLRRKLRTRINRRTQASNYRRMIRIDDEIGRLAKGMVEVSAMAQVVNNLCYLLYAVAAEQQGEEDDDSKLPAMLEDHVNDLLDTLVEMVQEEADEMREDISSHTSQAT